MGLLLAFLAGILLAMYVLRVNFTPVATSKRLLARLVAAWKDSF